jgi:Domain of unknown function (DUF4337)
MPLFGAKTAPAAGTEPKTLWDSVIGITPVLLTVVATLLAGLSSSEMTQAQFYRSMAAQQQSKAGDQWNFFQAKRIRGSNLELAVDLLPPAGDVAPESLQIALENLQAACQKLQKHREGLTAAFTNEKESDPKTRSAAGALLQQFGKQVDDVQKLEIQLIKQIQVTETRKSLQVLAGRELPAEEKTKEHAAPIAEAIQTLKSRKVGAEAREKIAQIPVDQVKQALETDDALVQAFNDLVKPIVRLADNFGETLTKIDKAVNACYRTARELENSDGLPSAQKKSVEECAAQALFAKTIADELASDFKSARHEFKAKTYEREARINEELAWLYEIQVTRSDVTAERHRQRSRFFFYGMLASQAGVTIASLALAMRHKSVLWSTATIAGIGAMIFSAYVYFSF